jgi:CHU_C Type IX secretion signal domain
MLKKCILILVCAVLYSLQNGHTQTTLCTSSCQGSLGENIFPDGDFGSGTTNIVAINPNIAPGYGYITSPPPTDGNYVVTNNTTSWGSFAMNWINIKDNSGVPNGYMMVVNAAVSPGLFYRKTVDVCDNTLYQMSVDLISLVEPNLGSTHIKSNVAFLIDGAVVCATGDIPHDADWHTYDFSFITDPGVNSVTLAFRNNAPGGNGNDLAIDNISFRACGPNFVIKDTIKYCPNGPLELQTTVLSSPYATPVYQWQYSTDGQIWSDIAGATSTTWTVTGPEKNGLFRLLSANSLGNLVLPNCRSVSNFVKGALDDLSSFKIGGTDTTVCNGNPAYLNAGIFAEYVWSDQSNGSQLEVLSQGLYSVTITSEFGCTATDDIFVEEKTLTAELMTENPFCFGEATGSASVVNTIGGSGNLSFSLNNGNDGNNPNFENLLAGNYTILLKDSLGCEITLPFTLVSPAALMVKIDPVPPVLVSTPIVITQSNNVNNPYYVWQSIGELSCSNCPNPTIIASKDAWLFVNVSDNLGCQAVDSIWIDVNPIIALYAPNAFAPEGTSGNVFFRLFLSKSAIVVRRFSIYDRWGSLVFNRENIDPFSDDLQWDGYTASDKKAASAVYFWYAEIEYEEGLVEKYKGDLLLVR